MKVINCAPDGDKERSSNAVNSWMRSMKFGEAWSKDMEAQETIIKALTQALDNRFFLLRNVELEGLDIPIPFILCGPPGVRVIYPSASRGVFRAKGEVWEALDDYKQIFRPAKPNLVARIALMTNAVTTYLSGRGFERLSIEPVLVFSDPGTHVDQVRPIVRIVLMDAIDRFTTGLIQSRTLMEYEQVEQIISVLTPEKVQSKIEASLIPERDAFSFQDEARPRTRSRAPSAVELRLNEMMTRLNRTVPFSNRQWLLLSVIVFLDILLLTAFAILLILSV